MLHTDGVHAKLNHNRWTGPWTVTALITPGLCYCIALQGRRERVRREGTYNKAPDHTRPKSPRHEFSDEFDHFAWGPDIGLAAQVATRYRVLMDLWNGDIVDVTSMIIISDGSSSGNAWTSSHPYNGAWRGPRSTGAVSPARP